MLSQQSAGVLQQSKWGPHRARIICILDLFLIQPGQNTSGAKEDRASFAPDSSAITVKLLEIELQSEFDSSMSVLIDNLSEGARRTRIDKKAFSGVTNSGYRLTSAGFQVQRRTIASECCDAIRRADRYLETSWSDVAWVNIVFSC